MTAESISVTRRWLILIVSTTTTLCATVFINGVVLLLPALRVERHMGLAEGALWSAMPSLGMAATLFGWGHLLDRIGERIVLTVGLGLTAEAAFAAASVHSMLAAGVLLLLGGMTAASSITASGRLVTGWFPPERRGVAMGIRQTDSHGLRFSADVRGVRPFPVGGAAVRPGGRPSALTGATARSRSRPAGQAPRKIRKTS